MIKSAELVFGFARIFYALLIDRAPYRTWPDRHALPRLVAPTLKSLAVACAGFQAGNSWRCEPAAVGGHVTKPPVNLSQTHQLRPVSSFACSLTNRKRAACRFVTRRDIVRAVALGTAARCFDDCTCKLGAHLDAVSRRVHAWSEEENLFLRFYSKVTN